MAALDFSVVIDITMTETAQCADYVLPALTQYEKYECTFFNLEFPVNVFHLRAPVLDGTGGAARRAGDPSPAGPRARRDRRRRPRRPARGRERRPRRLRRGVRRANGRAPAPAPARDRRPLRDARARSCPTARPRPRRSGARRSCAPRASPTRSTAPASRARARCWAMRCSRRRSRSRHGLVFSVDEHDANWRWIAAGRDSGRLDLGIDELIDELESLGTEESGRRPASTRSSSPPASAARTRR